MKIILGRRYAEKDKFTDLLLEELNHKGYNVELIKKYNKKGIQGLISKDSEIDALILQQYLEPSSPITVDFLNEMERYNPELKIVYVVSDTHLQDKAFLSNLYSNKIYNVLFERDADPAKIVELLERPRHPRITLTYFQLDEDSVKGAAAKSSSEMEEVTQTQLDAVFNHLYGSANLQDLYNRFDYVVSKFTQQQSLFILTQLPSEITEQLEDNRNYKALIELLTPKETEQVIAAAEPGPTKEKVIIKNKVVTKEIIQHVYQKPVIIHQKIILISNLSKRAGSTFTTLTLAKEISKLKTKVAVIEHPLLKPYVFDSLGFDVHLGKLGEAGEHSFYSYPHEIFNGQIIKRDKEIEFDNILWLIPDSRREPIEESKCVEKECLKDKCKEKKCRNRKWDFFKMSKLLNLAKKTSVVIIDVGDLLFHESVMGILDQVDSVLVIIDPMPSEIIQNVKKFDEIMELYNNGLPVEFVFNRWTDQVKEDEIFNYLQIEPLCKIPAIETALIHKAVYNCQIPNALPEVEEQLKKPLYVLMKSLLDEDLLASQSVQSGSKFSSIKDKFNSLKESILEYFY